jgi:hypothetical protein
MKCEYEPKNGVLFEKTRALILFWLEHPELENRHFFNHLFRYADSESEHPQLFETVERYLSSEKSNSEKTEAIAELMRVYSLKAHLRQLRMAVDQLMSSQMRSSCEGIEKVLREAIGELSCENLEENRRGYERLLTMLSKEIIGL